MATGPSTPCGCSSGQCVAPEPHPAVHGRLLGAPRKLRFGFRKGRAWGLELAFFRGRLCLSQVWALGPFPLSLLLSVGFLAEWGPPLPWGPWKQSWKPSAPSHPHSARRARDRAPQTAWMALGSSGAGFPAVLRMPRVDLKSPDAQATPGPVPPGLPQVGPGRGQCLSPPGVPSVHGVDGPCREETSGREEWSSLLRQRGVWAGVPEHRIRLDGTPLGGLRLGDVHVPSGAAGAKAPV